MLLLNLTIYKTKFLYMKGITNILNKKNNIVLFLIIKIIIIIGMIINRLCINNPECHTIVKIVHLNVLIVVKNVKYVTIITTQDQQLKLFYIINIDLLFMIH